MWPNTYFYSSKIFKIDNLKQNNDNVFRVYNVHRCKMYENHLCVCVCVYTHRVRERQTESQRDRETERERVAWPVCIFWKAIPCWLLHLQIFSLIMREVIHLVYSFLCCAKAFNYVLFVYFCFYFHYSRRWMKKHIAVIYIKECSACVFLWLL